jgi:hypothetical protein
VTAAKIITTQKIPASAENIKRVSMTSAWLWLNYTLAGIITGTGRMAAIPNLILI